MKRDGPSSKQIKSRVALSTSTPDASVASTGKAKRSLLGWLGILLGGLLAGLAIGWLVRFALMPDPAIDRAQALELARAQIVQAEPLLQRVLERNPRDVEVLQALLSLYLVADRPAEADALLARWCELEPDNLKPVRLRFQIAVRVFQQETAIACGRLLLQREADPEPILRQLISLEIKAGLLDDATAHAQQGLTRRPGDAEFTYLLAHVHHLKGEKDEAIRILDRLLASKEPYWPAVLLRGTIYRESDQPTQAIPLLRRVLAEDPDHRNRQTARYQLAQALFRLNQTPEAEALMQQWQRYEEARRTLVDAYQQRDNLTLRLRAGRLLLETDQETDGLGVLQEVLKQQPDCAEAHRILADYFDRRGDRERARQHRQRLAAGS